MKKENYFITNNFHPLIKVQTIILDHQILKEHFTTENRRKNLDGFSNICLSNIHNFYHHLFCLITFQINVFLILHVSQILTIV